ncbi:hypothetical protein BJ741DRAFT_609704 [Chytriomyces cf. hyalinus JEL632]|nr:hypothetical protein BJ741DRAFT_609704 [Chytriomyces cf. hyalinus JEL632]
MTKFAYAVILMLVLHRCCASPQDASKPPSNQPPPVVPARLVTPTFAIYNPGSVGGSIKPVQQKNEEESGEETRRKKRSKRCDPLPIPPVPRMRGYGEGDMMKELQEMLLPNGAAVQLRYQGRY